MFCMTKDVKRAEVSGHAVTILEEETLEEETLKVFAGE
jgi:hypothetical protein